jgi:23S rRNA (adenine2503-C2)-methyltransferase
MTGSVAPRIARSCYDATDEQLGELLSGEPAFRVGQVLDGLYRRVLRPKDMTDLPLGLRQRLEEALVPALTLRQRQLADDGDTVKWLWSAPGDALVESVLMSYPDRVTVCVSTQAGCAMGCSFCATGQAGFVRQLSAGEIVEQVVVATRAARPRRLDHVVFMGMGEPLANYQQLWLALRRLQGAMGLSARHLTVSTVGIVPGIRRLATEGLPVNLAVSLHAANDALRDTLVPINRRYPLGVLFEACRSYTDSTGRRLSLEWALIEDTNDRLSDARELADFARPLGAHVNLIPLNPTPGYRVRGTAPRGVAAFRRALVDRGVNTTVRQTRGRDIEAACGQLAGAQGTGAAGTVERRGPAADSREIKNSSVAPNSSCGTAP